MHNLNLPFHYIINIYYIVTKFMKLGLGHRNMRYNNKSLNLTENYYILELMLKISLRIILLIQYFLAQQKWEVILVKD